MALGRRLHLAPEGLYFPLLLGFLAIIAALFGLMWAAALCALIAVASALFFRDPERSTPSGRGIIISGADGKVVDISERQIPGLDSAGYRRVSVFMSPLNVHVNRAPVEGEVGAVEHTPGQFLAAFDDHASERNERTLVVFIDKMGRRHAMVQIAGYLARRIVCRLRTSDTILQGQRIGLIMFGSRVDHFLPPEYRVAVRIGQRVRAGETIIGELAQ